jgi:hypothetical protein
MSIIGHSIQSAVVNVHAAIKTQQAGQAAVTDEDTQRQNRIRREEELAREAVEKAVAARQARVYNPPPRGRRQRKNRPADPPPGDPAPGDLPPDPRASGHVDFLA